MIDGTYKITVDVPFGRKDGAIVLRTQGDTVFADIDAPVVGKQSVQGRASGDTFTAQGSGKIAFVGNIGYTFQGEVAGDKLYVDIRSNKGNFKLEGVRA